VRCAVTAEGAQPGGEAQQGRLWHCDSGVPRPHHFGAGCRHGRQQGNRCPDLATAPHCAHGPRILGADLILSQVHLLVR
jgi:hypothetical protein